MEHLDEKLEVDTGVDQVDEGESPNGSNVAPSIEEVIAEETISTVNEISNDERANKENISGAVENVTDVEADKENTLRDTETDNLKKENSETGRTENETESEHSGVLTDILNKVDEIAIHEEEKTNEDSELKREIKNEMNMIHTPDEVLLQVLSQYKTIALKTENHPVLMKDSATLMYLAYSVGHTNLQIVFEGLAVLHLLSQKAENRRALSKVMHMMDSLQIIIKNEDKVYPDETVAFAAMIYDLLRKAPKLPSKLEKMKGKERNARAKAQDANRKMSRSMTKSKPVYLYIPYNIFFKEKRNTVTQTLQQDKDVLSITFDMNKCLCVLRVKNHALPETFGKAVANLGFECYLVALNEKNEEIKIQMMGDSKLGKDVYEYLSESDEENNKSREEKVIATAEDVKRKNEKQGSGWFAAAKSLFW